jgi:hypothetical protein
MLGVIFSYETLDKLADSYIPVLLIAFLLAVTITFFRTPDDRKRLGKVFVYALALVLISYGLMFLDKAVHLWDAAGLDYSTHTAVSLSLVIPLCILLGRYRVIVVFSFAAYSALMLYQGYHSVLDILTTGIIIALCGFLLFRLLLSR